MKTAQFITDKKQILDKLNELRYTKDELLSQLKDVKLSEKSRRKAVAFRESVRRGGSKEPSRLFGGSRAVGKVTESQPIKGGLLTPGQKVGFFAEKKAVGEAQSATRGVARATDDVAQGVASKVGEATTNGLDTSLIRKSKEQVQSILQTVGKRLPIRSRVGGETAQELQRSEILSSLPPLNRKTKTESIAREYAEYKKATEGIRGVWINIRETVQDSFIRARKLQEKVVRGADIPDDINIDQARTLFDGRVDARLRAAKESVTKIDQSILSTARKLGVADNELSREVDSFLHARHALERNARLGDGAAGLKNQEAKQILKAIESSPHQAEVKIIAEGISELNRKTLKTLLDAEVIDKELFDLLNKTYKNHVPLQRVLDESEDIAQSLTGRGLDVRSTGLRKAVGSDRPIADILTNVTANLDQAIIRAEKNLVDLTTLRFARANKHLGIFEEVKPKVIGKTGDGPSCADAPGTLARNAAPRTNAPISTRYRVITNVRRQLLHFVPLYAFFLIRQVHYFLFTSTVVAEDKRPPARPKAMSSIVSGKPSWKERLRRPKSSNASPKIPGSGKPNSRDSA
ncbi:MAG: hypothetical protein WD850_03485 [Candidatus Spechtbacterales bacterium]